MKTKKSLCESCSNIVDVKYHNKESKYNKVYCFFDFIKDHWNSIGTKTLDSIVDECSFYNKTMPRLKQKESKKIKEQDSDDSDYGTDSEGNRMHGVTFTNIPGALM